MDLTVFGNRMALAVENVGSVIDTSIVCEFRQRAGGQVDMELLRQSREGSPRGALIFFRIFGEICSLIGTGKHFRQADEIGLLGAGL